MGVELMSRLSWSSKAVEEGHASASTLVKLHPVYGADMMKARAMLCQSRALFQRHRLHKRVALQEARVARLKRCNPDKITGKAIYVKELFALLRQQKQGGRQVKKDATKGMIKRHGKL